MSHPSKRVKVDTAAVATAQYYNTTGTVPSSFQLSADLSYLITTQPNCTIAAFELPQECMENEIYEAFMRCGQVKSVQKICGGRAALIEFPEISTPTRLVHWAKINPFFIGVYRVRLEFSSQTITTPAVISKPQLNENIMSADSIPNNVILLNIRNAEYPITVSVLKAICSRHGTLQRVYIGKVNVDKSLAALVEFATIEEATKAREHLDGADIYSGCCSLSVNFSKMKKILVARNNDEQWDFTDLKEGLLSNVPSSQRTLLPIVANGYSDQQLASSSTVHPAPPPIPSNVPSMGFQQPYCGYYMPPGQYMQPPGYYPQMIPSPPISGYPGSSMPYSMHPPIPSPYYQQPGYQYYPQQHFPPHMPTATVRAAPQILPTPPPIHHVAPGGIGLGHSTSNLNSTSVAAAKNADMSIFHAERGAVLVVSNLPEGINCDSLFNVICLYGNVARIKFLKSRPGCVIVQMGSKEAAELVSQHLKGATLFGQAIHFHPSEQIEIQEHAGLGTLPDGSPVMKNYMTDSNNRFRNAAFAAKSRILAPTRTLHFFNAPLNFSPEDMCHVFSDCGLKRPPRIVVFTAKPGQKTSLGLAEWDTIGESLDALALANHRPIHIAGFAHPFHMKLAFSPKPISDDRAGQTMINYPAPPMQISRGPQLNTPHVVTVPASNTAAFDGRTLEPLPSSPPFDVKAVELEEAAFLASNGAVFNSESERSLSSPPPSALPSSPSSIMHQPPKTPEEEEGGGALVEDHQAEASTIIFHRANELQQVQVHASSELSEGGISGFREIIKTKDKEEKKGTVENEPYVQKTVHQPPATPPSESPSSTSYSPSGDGES